MLVVNGELAAADPHTVLEKVSNTLQSELGNLVEIKIGSVAVTVLYPDGTEIQLVPLIKVNGELRVPAWEGDCWSTINAQQFREGLTKRNEECAGKLIPTLKLAKVVNSTLPEKIRMSGYHIESLGVAAFRDYSDIILFLWQQHDFIHFYHDKSKIRPTIYSIDSLRLTFRKTLAN